VSPSLGTFFLFDHLKINGYIKEIIYVNLLHNMAWVKDRIKTSDQRLPPTNAEGHQERGREQEGSF